MVEITDKEIKDEMLELRIKRNSIDMQIITLQSICPHNSTTTRPNVLLGGTTKFCINCGEKL
jgi:hypothetical protein